MSSLTLFQLVTGLNTQNTHKTKIHNDLREINWYMNIRICNWHSWSMDPRKWIFCLYVCL